MQKVPAVDPFGQKLALLQESLERDSEVAAKRKVALLKTQVDKFIQDCTEPSQRAMTEHVGRLTAMMVTFLRVPEPVCEPGSNQSHLSYLQQQECVEWAHWAWRVVKNWLSVWGGGWRGDCNSLRAGEVVYL